MKKAIARAVLGLVTSIVIASVGNRLLRAARERSRSPADALHWLRASCA